MLARLSVLPLLWGCLIGAVLVFGPLFRGLGGPSEAGVATMAAIPPPAILAVPSMPQGPASSIEYATFAETAGQRAPGADPWLDVVEAEVLRLVNEARRTDRPPHPPLELDDRLVLAARAHSRDMLDRGYFQHVTPEGLSPADRIAGVHRRMVGTTGENIFSAGPQAAASPPAAAPTAALPAAATPTVAGPADPAELARLAMVSLMQSPGHRANILEESYTHIGIGVAAEGDRVRVTQAFATIRARLAAPLPLRVARQSVLDLRVDDPRAVQPAEYALFAPARGLRDFGPVPAGTPVQATRTEPRRLQLYFREGNASIIVFGPDLVVE